MTFSRTRRVLAVVARNQERQLQGLLLIEPRITVGGVIQAQVFIIKTLASTCTFCNRISCELEMHTTQEGAVLLVNLQGR